MKLDLAPMPAAMHVGALLMHVMDGLTGALPSPLALTSDGSKVLLLEGQRVRSSSPVNVPADVKDIATLLVEKARYILDEAQDLVVSSTGRMWPEGAAAHPAAQWTDEGLLRLGYYPSADIGQPPVLAVPDFLPPSGAPRVAG